MLNKRVRSEYVSILCRLYQHLVDSTVILPQSLLHIFQLLVQPASFLHPELLYPVLHHHGLQPDAKGAQQEETDKENLASMLLYEMSQLVKFLLYSTPDPERRFVSCGPTLEISCWIIRKISEGT